jgi:hypothetical protein
MSEENLKYWNTFNQPPRSALKEIQAGRMKGKTDINPQWRYKAMTETFGVVGIGWKFTVDRMWTEQAANNEVMAFVNISVYVKVGEVWSDAIPGSGGATLVVQESKGMYNDDDAYKKATTDALSTAMKMLGVAADIYAGGWDGTKFKQENKQPQLDHRAELVKRYNALVQKAVAAKLANIPELLAEMTEEEITAAGVKLAERIKEGK